MKYKKIFYITTSLIATNLSIANAFGADLPDMCSTQGASTSISDGSPICVSNNGTAYLSLGGASNHNSIAISTAHGTGDLNLYVGAGVWPSTASNSTAYKSLTAGTNSECVIISNPNQYWTMIAVTGTRNNASLSVDFGATSCRTSNGGGDTGGGSGGNNTGPVPAPNNLAGSPGTNSINLTWNDNSNNEDSFTLQRSAPGGSWVTIATPEANTTSYNDSSLSPNSTYYYTMHAKNSTNTSAWSSTITVQTLDAGSTDPTDPTNPTDPINTDVLADICATQEPTTVGSLTDGVPVCVPAASNRHGFSVSTFNLDVTSIAFSSAHGLGNLTLAGSANGWPAAGDDSIRSSHVGNTECVVLTQPKNGWNNVSLEGLFKGVSVVADFNQTSCRVTPGAVDPGNDGYDYDRLHVIVYPFRFPNKDLSFTPAQINAEMEIAKQYFTEQSYGKFTFTWEIKNKITMPSNSSVYDNDKARWAKEYKEQIVNTGVDPNFPGEATIVMVTSEKIGPKNGADATAINSQAGPPLMEIYTHAASTIAHEAIHAMGLQHAMGLEGGNSTINGNANDSILNYANVFDLMGMGGHTLEEINLAYKNYFNWFSNTDVPTITTSGTYRLYTFNHGTASGHNAPGAIGLKLKSGGTGDKTYFIEYRTVEKSEINSPSPIRTPFLENGISINLINYLDNTADIINKAPWYNHNSLLLDATPNSRNSSWAPEDFNDAPLQINQTFTDPWNGFSIYPTGKGGTLGTAGAWIDVQVTIF
jgi:hypothetical protein